MHSIQDLLMLLHIIIFFFYCYKSLFFYLHLLLLWACLQENDTIVNLQSACRPLQLSPGHGVSKEQYLLPVDRYSLLFFFSILGKPILYIYIYLAKSYIFKYSTLFSRLSPADYKTMPYPSFPSGGQNPQKKLLDSPRSGVGKCIALRVLPVPDWPELTWNKPFVFLQRNTRLSTWPFAQV